MSENSSLGIHWRGRPLKGVLFDLDGTLLDTASDIAHALNLALGEYGIAAFPVSEVILMVGRGSPILIERATAARGRTLSDKQRAAVLDRFFHYYGELEEQGKSEAVPYPGAAEALRRLHTAGVKTAVVTNKHHRFANALMENLKLSPWIDLIVGGDTCERRKPDPQPLLFACSSLGFTAAEALMVGDSINDVGAARAARIPVVCVPYGYNEGRDPRTLDCDAMVESLAELPDLVSCP